MGWTTWNKPAQQSAVDALRQHYGEKWWDERVISAATYSDCVCVILRCEEPDSKTHVPDADGFIRVIGVLAIKRWHGYENFGVKDMTETMGPNGYECSPAFIAKASPLRPLSAPLPAGGDGYDHPDGSLAYAHAYRARSIAMAAKRQVAAKRKRELKAGDKVQLPNGWQLEAVAGSFRYRGRPINLAFRRLDTGALIALTARQLGEAIAI